MQARTSYSVLYLMVISLCLGCASKQSPEQMSPSVQSDQAARTPSESQPVELQSITVEEENDQSNIIFTASSALSPNIFKLSDPDRIVIDFTETTLGPIERNVLVQQGAINNITTEQFDESNGSLSRSIILLSTPADYRVESKKNKLMVRVFSEGGMATVDTASVPDLPAPFPTEVGEDSTLNLAVSDPHSQQFSADDSPIPPTQQFNTTTADPFFTPEASETGLVDVQYQSSAQGTTIRLVGSQALSRYEDFVLSNPPRIVLDFDGTKNFYPGENTIALGTEQVSKVRLGGDTDKVRVVLDLASGDVLPYSISSEGDVLVVRVDTLNAVAQAPVQSPVETVSEPVQDRIEPTPVNFDQQNDFDFEPATPEPFAAAAQELNSGRRVTVTALDFNQMPAINKSRLTISTNRDDVQYKVDEVANNEFKVTIPNSKVKNTLLRRKFDTSEFPSAVVGIEPTVNSGDTEVMFKLAQNVPYSVSQEGNRIHTDIELIENIAPQQNSEDIPVTLAQAPTQSIVQESSDDSEFMRSSKLMSTAPNKNYRYVKEEFMSDTINSNEPLSRMAEILSGTVGGKGFSGRKISLDFKDAEVRSIFRLIADISRFNIIISDDVTGRITIRLDDVPWDQAFAIILQTRGLWFEKYDNIIRVAPADKLTQERERSAAAREAAKAAQPLDVLFKPVSFAQAGTLIKQVSTVLSERGTVDIDSRTNTLIIKDIREHLEKARKMVDILDTQTPQVTIESRIVEATTTFTRSFGISWSGNARFTSATGNPTGVSFPNSVQVSPFALNFPVEAGFINSTANIALGSINNILDLDLALAIGEQEGHSKLISAPKVTVLDNKPATITAGSRIPFLTQTANAGSNVRFENAATTLTVTPHITNDGSILMSISASRNEPNFATLVQGNPIIDQRTANTEVLVKSGNTTVIGGIYSTQSGRSQSRFPVLHKIPLLGALFKNYDKQVRRTELLIFVTPRIVGDEREAIKDVRG